MAPFGNRKGSVPKAKCDRQIQWRQEVGVEIKMWYQKKYEWGIGSLLNTGFYGFSHVNHFNSKFSMYLFYRITLFNEALSKLFTASFILPFIQILVQILTECWKGYKKNETDFYFKKLKAYLRLNTHIERSFINNVTM